jgi:hypothetical protein
MTPLGKIGGTDPEFHGTSSLSRLRPWRLFVVEDSGAIWRRPEWIVVTGRLFPGLVLVFAGHGFVS